MPEPNSGTGSKPGRGKDRGKRGNGRGRGSNRGIGKLQGKSSADPSKVRGSTRGKPNGSRGGRNGRGFGRGRNRGARGAGRTAWSARNSNDHGIKLVVRLLPPGLTESQFWDHLAIHLKIDSHDQLKAHYSIHQSYYMQGKYSSKAFKPPRHARCYLMFTDEPQLQKFMHDIRGLELRDDLDNIAQWKLHISPYVKGFDPEPPNNTLTDTIEKDPLYKQFLRTLQFMETADDRKSLAFQDFSLLTNIKEQAALRNKIEAQKSASAQKALKQLTLQKDTYKKKHGKKDRVPKNNAETAATKAAIKSSKKKKKKKKLKMKNLETGAIKADGANKVVLEAAGKEFLKNQHSLNALTTR